MKRVPIGLVLPTLAGLFFASTAAAHAAVGDTAQTTGGGWIVPQIVVVIPTSTPTAAGMVSAAVNNPKATFGFVASATVQADGATLGGFQGELSYHDHAVELKLHSLSVTQVTVIDAQTMSFSGTADVETAAGSVPSDFTVTVHDASEPGIGVDSFAILLPNFTLPGETAPYHRQGLLGGGNIQVRP
jgi:hypothetical protein